MSALLPPPLPGLGAGLPLALLLLLLLAGLWALRRLAARGQAQRRRARRGGRRRAGPAAAAPREPGARERETPWGASCRGPRRELPLGLALRLVERHVRHLALHLGTVTSPAAGRAEIPSDASSSADSGPSSLCSCSCCSGRAGLAPWQPWAALAPADSLARPWRCPGVAAALPRRRRAPSAELPVLGRVAPRGLEFNGQRKPLQALWGGPTPPTASLARLVPRAPALHPASASRVSVLSAAGQEGLDGHMHSKRLHRGGCLCLAPHGPPPPRPPHGAGPGETGADARQSQEPCGCPPALPPGAAGCPAALGRLSPREAARLQLHGARKCLEIRAGAVPAAVSASQAAARARHPPALPKPLRPGRRHRPPRPSSCPALGPEAARRLRLHLCQKGLRLLWGLPALHLEAGAQLPPRLPAPHAAGAPGVEFTEQDTPFLSPAARGSLEWHVRSKRLQQHWGCPSLLQRSLAAFLAPAPRPGARPPRPPRDLTVAPQELPFLGRGAQRDLESHLIALRAQRRWGLPGRVQASLRRFMPPAPGPAPARETPAPGHTQAPPSLHRPPTPGHASRPPTPGHGASSRPPTPGHAATSRPPTPGHASRPPTPGHAAASRPPTSGHTSRPPTPGHGAASRPPTPGHGESSRPPTPGHAAASRPPTPGHGASSRLPTPGHASRPPTPGHASRPPTPGHAAASRPPTSGHASHPPTPGHAATSRPPTPGYAATRRPPTSGHASRPPTSGHTSRPPTPGHAAASHPPTSGHASRPPTPGHAAASRPPTPGHGASSRPPTPGHAATSRPPTPGHAATSWPPWQLSFGPADSDSDSDSLLKVPSPGAAHPPGSGAAVEEEGSVAQPRGRSGSRRAPRPMQQGDHAPPHRHGAAPRLERAAIASQSWAPGRGQQPTTTGTALRTDTCPTLEARGSEGALRPPQAGPPPGAPASPERLARAIICSLGPGRAARDLQLRLLGRGRLSVEYPVCLPCGCCLEAGVCPQHPAPRGQRGPRLLVYPRLSGGGSPGGRLRLRLGFLLKMTRKEAGLWQLPAEPPSRLGLGEAWEGGGPGGLGQPTKQRGPDGARRPRAQPPCRACSQAAKPRAPPCPAVPPSGPGGLPLLQGGATGRAGAGSQALSCQLQLGSASGGAGELPGPTEPGWAPRPPRTQSCVPRSPPPTATRTPGPRGRPQPAAAQRRIGAAPRPAPGTGDTGLKSLWASVQRAWAKLWGRGKASVPRGAGGLPVQPAPRGRGRSRSPTVPSWSQPRGKPG